MTDKNIAQEIKEELRNQFRKYAHDILIEKTYYNQDTDYFIAVAFDSISLAIQKQREKDIEEFEKLMIKWWNEDTKLKDILHELKDIK